MARSNGIVQPGKYSGGPLGDSQRDPRHGTTSGYTYWGCRCDRCIKAIRDSQKRTRARNLAKLGPGDHGLKAYKQAGCRCEVCKEAGRAEGRRYNAARKLRRPTTRITPVDLSGLA